MNQEVIVVSNYPFMKLACGGFQTTSHLKPVTDHEHSRSLMYELMLAELDSAGVLQSCVPPGEFKCLLLDAFSLNMLVCLVCCLCRRIK